MHQKCRLGFTLVETILTLGIFCLLLIIGNSTIQDYQVKTEETLVLKRFDNLWKNELNYAYLTGEMISIYVYDNKIEFSANGQKPRSLQLKTFHTDAKRKLIFNSGQTSPGHITLWSKVTNEEYHLTFQMKWGVLFEDKKPRISVG